MKISVIVPVYKTEEFVGTTVESLLNQTYSDYEILLINDGSPDNSAKILAEYGEKYPEKIRVFNKENGGLSSARNLGIKYADGEFLAFVDSDDTVDERFLETLINSAQSENADIVTCDFYYVFSDGRKIYSPITKSLSPDPVRDYILSGPMACVRLIKKELLTDEGFTEGILYEDLERIPRLILKTEKVARVKEPVYNYFVRTNSIMNKPVFSDKQLDIFTVLDSNYSHFAKAGKLSKFHGEIEYLYIEHLMRSAALRFADYSNAEELFTEINSAITEKFPNWKKNPYLKKSGLKFRLVTFLSSHGKIFLIKLLKSINK